jgi:hypothetical protein
MFDNDERGLTTARDFARRRLGKHIIYYTIEYPEGRKDPQECTKEEIDFMLKNKKNILLRNLKKL